MKIVHTADVHLSKDHPERLEALKEVISVCDEEEADLLLISGDLFDRNTGPDDYETEIRPLFSDNSFHTLVIPGNHDESAFREGSYFGNDIDQLLSRPFESKEYEGVKITGVPYTEEGFSELVSPLSEESDEDVINLLMIHCTLSGATGGFGEESKYLPVKPQELIESGYDYVFSGHIHSSATKKQLENIVFTYPGSPVSISSSETGRRHVWVFDTEVEKLESRKLDTFHYLKEKIEVMPKEEDIIDRAIQGFKDKDLSKASITIELNGFTDRKIQGLTTDVKQRISNLEPKEINVDNSGLESMASVINSDIYKEFTSKMEKEDLEKPKEVEKKFLRALSRYDRR